MACWRGPNLPGCVGNHLEGGKVCRKGLLKCCMGNIADCLVIGLGEEGWKTGPQLAQKWERPPRYPGSVIVLSTALVVNASGPASLIVPTDARYRRIQFGQMFD